jgi:hypothetical protein
MNVILLKLLAFFFAPFLKGDAEEKEEEDFYQLLKVKKNSSFHEIKKSYRKASLMMHPDKVAQFSNATHKTEQEIQHEFVLIKEAYETLSDPNKRSLYDALGKEGMKAMNREDGGLNIHSFVYNLSHSSCIDRSKLFLLPLLLVGFFLITPILICAKVDSTLASKTGLSDVSWLLILIPIWILDLGLISIHFLGKDFFAFGKMVCITVTEVFLALRWDHHIQWKYSIVLIPLFAHQFIGILESISVIHTSRHDMSRMATVSWLNKNVIPNFKSTSGDEEDTIRRTYDDLTEEEKELINEMYIIVEDLNDQMQDDDQSTSSLQEEVNLLNAISKSPEFKLASIMKGMAQKQMFSIIFFHIAFLVLVVSKLDGEKNWSWHIVFTPLWIELCIKSLSDCFQSFCLPYTVNRDDNAFDVNHFEKEDENDSAYEKPEEKITNIAEDQILQISRVQVQQNVDTATIEESAASENHKCSNDGCQDKQSTGVMHEDCTQDVEIVDEENVPVDDDPYVEFDPESFENQGKAMCSCCIDFLLIIGLSLFLVKLDGSENEGGQGQFSSFWVIFPLLLVAGLVLLVFACCIYASSHADQVDNMIHKRDANNHVSDKLNPDTAEKTKGVKEGIIEPKYGTDVKIDDLD